MSRFDCASRKVVIGGAGSAGATFAFALAQTCVVTRRGAERIIRAELREDEACLLGHSADFLRQAVASVDLQER